MSINNFTTRYQKLNTEQKRAADTIERPVLVFKKLSGENFIGLPLSSKEKIGTWFTDISINNEKRFVLLYQIRMYHTNRFQRRLATLDEKDFKKVKEKLEQLLGFNHHQDIIPESVGYPQK